MIPETAPGSLETIPEGQAMMVQTDVNGNKVYASDLLASKVFGLSQAMRVGRKVCTCLCPLLVLSVELTG